MTAMTNLRYLQQDPRTSKNATIKLSLSQRETTFVVDLTIESVEHFHREEDYPCVLGDVSGQVNNIKYQTKCNLVEQFPSITSTINIIFLDNPTPLLLSLSSSRISYLMSQLRSILFSPLLLMIKSLDVVLFVIIRFLHQVSLILQSVESCEYFPQLWVELGDKCKKYFYQHQVEYLAEVRVLYVDMWCRLLSAE